MSLAIETNLMCKKYGTSEALRDLTLDVPEGAIFGLIGRNGAGKSTSLNLIVGLLRPDSGWARIGGHDTHLDAGRARSSMAFVPEEPSIYPWLTVSEAGMYWRGLAQSWNASVFQSYITQFDLPLGRRVGRLSKGMRTQLMLALAVAKEPNIYILDEPTSGLDPVARREVLHFLKAEAIQKGKTILLSSHVLSELDAICTHIGLLDKGRLKTSTGVADLRRHWKRYDFRSSASIGEHLTRMGASYSLAGDTYSLFIGPDDLEVLKRVSALPITDLRASEMGLEDIFLRLVGAPCL